MKGIELNLVNNILISNYVMSTGSNTNPQKKIEHNPNSAATKYQIDVNICDPKIFNSFFSSAIKARATQLFIEKISVKDFSIDKNLNIVIGVLGALIGFLTGIRIFIGGIIIDVIYLIISIFTVFIGVWKYNENFKITAKLGDQYRTHYYSALNHMKDIILGYKMEYKQIEKEMRTSLDAIPFPVQYKAREDTNRNYTIAEQDIIKALNQILS